MCLRDSIGGNCKTRMIANLSCDFDDVFESLSTCRFAQRVALIKNTAVVNEVVDPSVLIQKQKSEIEELKAELEMLKGKNQKSFLEKSDLEECNKIVKEFLEDETFKVKIELNDKLMIQECFNIIKIKYKDMEKKLKANSGEIVLNGTQDLDKIINLENENKRLQAEIDRLKELLSNREEEMKVLIKNIDNKKNEGNKTLLQKIQQEENEALNKIKNNILGNFVKFDNLTSANNSKINESNFLEDNNISSIVNQTQKSTVKTQFVPPNLIKEINLANSYIKNPNSSEINFELLKNRNNAYLFFKNNYYLKEVEIQNKEKIQEKFKFGKEISVEYSKLSSQIQTLKKKIEDIRKIRILDESKKNDENLNKEEDDLMKKFMSMKANEKIQKEELKKLHSEIKTMQTVDSQFDIKRIKHFEFWSETMIKKIEFENKNGKIDFSNLNSSILTNNNFISNNLNESTISQASELNEKLTKKLEQLK
jgi:kinesin family protein 6/9